MSKEGMRLMLSITQQQATAEAALGRLASHMKSGENWQDVVDKYYEEHPFKSPWDDKKALTDDEFKAHMPDTGVGSKSSRPDGTKATAKDPNTGDVIAVIAKGGQWVPDPAAPAGLQPAPASPAAPAAAVPAAPAAAPTAAAPAAAAPAVAPPLATVPIKRDRFGNPVGESPF
jgi:hypothetical protein